VKSSEYDGLRSFLRTCQELGEITTVDGADWNLEIEAVTEMVSELIPEPPAIMFDNIKGYPSGFRVLSNVTANRVRTAIALQMPPETPRSEIVRRGAQEFKRSQPIEPVEVATGPVMENVITGDDVDVLKFPALWGHRGDGGRYIGTGDTFVNRDPETGYVNMGTYRMQVHEPNLLGIWQSPGQQGRQIAERYWAEGKSCPVVATFGGDPLVFLASHTKFGWGVSEYDRVGSILGFGLPVVTGPLTGLPIPAHAEIAIEGEMPPPSVESRSEGPFGEWPGYFAASTSKTGDKQPVIRVKAIYHRNDPILLNMAPQWPGAPHHSVRFAGAILWEQLEAAGVQGIVGVEEHTHYLIAIAIKQRFAGHARQAGMVASGCGAIARNGRYIVIVDEDIDVSNLQEVVWAMMTRVDPATDIQIFDNAWATPLDPRMPPDVAMNGPHTNSRAIFYAVRPWAWRDKFPKVNRIDADQREDVLKKYVDVFNFPKM
jgi:UbiD family decarboxylase